MYPYTFLSHFIYFRWTKSNSRLANDNNWMGHFFSSFSRSHHNHSVHSMTKKENIKMIFISNTDWKCRNHFWTENFILVYFYCCTHFFFWFFLLCMTNVQKLQYETYRKLLEFKFFVFPFFALTANWRMQFNSIHFLLSIEMSINLFLLFIRSAHYFWQIHIE